jgi:hypothetical protein
MSEDSDFGPQSDASGHAEIDTQLQEAINAAHQLLISARHRTEQFHRKTFMTLPEQGEGDCRSRRVGFPVAAGDRL